VTTPPNGTATAWGNLEVFSMFHNFEQGQVVISKQVVDGTSPLLYICADRSDRTRDAGTSA
jgi:hypothetical protein